MGGYIARRILLGIVTVWIVTIILFGGLRVVVPIFYGDVVDIIVASTASATTRSRTPCARSTGSATRSRSSTRAGSATC